MRNLIVFLVLLLSIAACEPETPQLSGYERKIHQARFERDMRLRDDDTSILARDARERFRGLRYFPVDSTYRFRLALEPAPEETLRVSLRKGGADRYVRRGYVHFSLHGEPQRLGVYRALGGPGTLWLPFRDETTGEESYGGGRYLNPVLEGDSLVVDFNDAYNPDCDYNPEMFNCALPPAENRITVRVEAGEMKSLLYENL